MPNEPYSNRELDHFFADFKKQLTRIETQTTRTNGRVSRLELGVLIVGAVVATLVLTSAPDLFAFIMSIVL